MERTFDAVKPLISCVCITERRVNFLQHAVNCFVNQTYPNKELVIVHKESDIDTLNYIRDLDDPAVRSAIISEYESETLGERRNFSIQQSRGEYFCQWDDDDWYHNQRLQIQMEYALRHYRDGSVLSQLIFFNKVTKKAYFSYSRPWENTILCRVDSLSNGFEYKKLNRMEDTAFVKELLQHNKLIPVSFPAYIYVYHGNNTSSQGHFEDLCSMSQELSSPLSKSINDIIEGVISNDAASKLLMTREVQQEFNFFHIPPQLLPYI